MRCFPNDRTSTSSWWLNTRLSHHLLLLCISMVNGTHNTLMSLSSVLPETAYMLQQSLLTGRLLGCMAKSKSPLVSIITRLQLVQCYFIKGVWGLGFGVWGLGFG